MSCFENSCYTSSILNIHQFHLLQHQKDVSCTLSKTSCFTGNSVYHTGLLLHLLHNRNDVFTASLTQTEHWYIPGTYASNFQLHIWPGDRVKTYLPSVSSVLLCSTTGEEMTDEEEDFFSFLPELLPFPMDLRLGEPLGFLLGEPLDLRDRGEVLELEWSGEP